MSIKFHIDPWEESIDGTVCATIRAIWREGHHTNNQKIMDLASVAFDKANRMDRALKKYRKRFMQLPEELQMELHNITGED